MNMVVILILSVSILSMGVYFVGKIVNKGTDMADHTMSSVDEDLAAIMCDSSEIVCLQPGNIDMGIGDSRKITLKINNMGDEAEFRYNISLTGAYVADGTGSRITNADEDFITDSWMIYDNAPFTIKANSDKRKGIGIQVLKKMSPSDSTIEGVYNFALRVERNNMGSWEKYGRTQAIILNVK